jgi:hypothetical protein
MARLSSTLIQAPSRNEMWMRALTSAYHYRLMPSLNMTLSQCYYDWCRGKMTAIRRNGGLIQLALATVQALKCPQSSVHDSLFGVEKGLLQVLGDDTDWMPAPLRSSVKRSNGKVRSQSMKGGWAHDDSLHVQLIGMRFYCRIYSVEDILVLLIFVYSLAGSYCYSDQEEENFLKVSTNTL